MTRIFKTGGVEIVETDAMKDKTIEQVQAMLAGQYPEVRNATIRTKAEGDIQVVEFLPRAGRKG